MGSLIRTEASCRRPAAMLLGRSGLIIVGVMRCPIILPALLAATFAAPWQAFAQQPVPPPAGPAPAQVVLIFKSDPAEFGPMTLGGVPFAAPGLSMDFGSVWPVAGGKNELVVSAPGAEERKFVLETQAGGLTLLLLGLAKNPDSTKSAQFPKAVTASSVPLSLKVPQKTAEVFAFVPPRGAPLTGELVHGNAAAMKIALPAGKLTSLGEGQTGLTVAGQPVVFVDPGNPGAYVFVLLTDEKNKLRSVPFSFTVTEPEDPAKAKENAAQALDY